MTRINTFRCNTDIKILPPPVPICQHSDKTLARTGRPISILNIGRFFAGGHNKRQDVLVDALKALLETGLDVELHLVGALHTQPIHTQHLDTLRQKAQGLPVYFHVNASPSYLDYWLRHAVVYWHATGFGIDPHTETERCEHFGISVVEAMAAGCVPFVVANGGPTEFVREGQTGFCYSTIQELVTKTKTLLDNPERASTIAKEARRQAELFSEKAFKESWQRMCLEPL